MIHSELQAELLAKVMSIFRLRTLQQTPPIASGSIPFPVVFPPENVLIVRTPAKVLPRLHIPAPSTTRLARVVVDHVLPDPCLHVDTLEADSPGVTKQHEKPPPSGSLPRGSHARCARLPFLPF